MLMIDNVPNAFEETYLKMKSEQGKRLEVKVIGGNYYLYVAKGIWGKKGNLTVKKTVLMGSIDETGSYREKRPKRIFSSSRIYEYGNSQLVWNLAQDMYTIMERHPVTDPVTFRQQVHGETLI